jgi:hypothetical protein
LRSVSAWVTVADTFSMMRRSCPSVTATGCTSSAGAALDVVDGTGAGSFSNSSPTVEQPDRSSAATIPPEAIAVRRAARRPLAVVSGSRTGARMARGLGAAGSFGGLGPDLRRGPRVRRMCTRPQMYRARPTRRSTPPPMMSGPAHGVEEDSGQLTLTLEGAGAVPSEATSTETSSGTFIVQDRDPSPARSSSHRSEPAGFGTASSAGSAGAVSPVAGSSASPSAASGSTRRALSS